MSYSKSKFRAGMRVAQTLLALALLIPANVHAAQPTGLSENPTTVGPIHVAAPYSAARHQNDVREIDLTVSHERKLTDEEKLAYEDLFKAFADNVYEMTNGAHKLRNILFFDDGRFSDRADIVFSQSTTRSNAIPSNYGKDKLSRSGMSIEDRLGQPPVSEQTMRSLAGTLAHEFGHYFYGALDEYIEQGRPLNSFNPGQPSQNDTPPEPCSLMSGCYSTFEGANFSTRKSTKDAGKTNNANYRVYKASAWEALARDPKDDPLVLRFNPNVGPEYVPSTRLYWPELADHIPPADQFRTVELPDAQTEARSALKITWADANATDNHLRYFLVDVSANMGQNQRLENAKTALKAYVDAAAVNDQIGIATFADTDNEIQPLTKIVDDNTKTDIKNAIDGIELSSVANQRVVSIADQKAITALAEASTFGLIADRAVYVIINGAFTERGPGGGFSGTGFEKVSAAHGNAGIPISIFNFNDCGQPGDFWGGCSTSQGSSISVLRGVVGATMAKPGKYKYIGNGPFDLSSTRAAKPSKTWDTTADADEVVNALMDSDEALSPKLDINLGSAKDVSVTVEQPFSSTIYVDPTLDQLEVQFAFDAASEAAQLEVLDPNGQPLLSPPLCDSDTNESICHVVISDPITGTWSIGVQAISQTFMLSYESNGVAGAGSTFQAALTSLHGDSIPYPDPVVLIASVSKINPIAGAGVIAWVQGPNDFYSDITLKDDGILPDLYPNDGQYSGLMPYAQSGDYHITALFDNIAGSAYYATEGLADGDVITTPVGIDFDRFASYDVFVGEVVADDVGNDAAGAGQLPGDNDEAFGRLENANDVDLFQVISLTTSSAAAFGARATLASPYVLRFGALNSGMDAQITVLTDSGSLTFTPGVLGYSQYFTTEVDAAPGQPITIEISQRTNQSPAGNYALSFGKPRASELSSVALTINKDGTGSGTISSEPSGISCGITCTTSFDPGTLVTLTASANLGATFAGWSGACSGAATTCQISIIDSTVVTATFNTAPSNTPQPVFMPLIMS